MLHVGITGGIGSGKTTFLKVWEGLGAQVVYTDELARELMVRNPDLRSQIIKMFGEKAYYKDGSLNRELVAQMAFDNGKIATLNELVHPVVYRELEIEKQQALADNVSLFAHESALILDPGQPDICDVVILIFASQKLQIQRVSLRDGCDEENVRSRMRKQSDFNELAKRADLVIYNDDSIERLKAKAEIIYSELATDQGGR